MSKCIIPWTIDEDNAIVRTMGTLTKNDSITKAFKKLSKRLNRSKSAIQMRWYVYLRPKNTVSNQKDKVSNKPLLVQDLLEEANKKYKVGQLVQDACTGEFFNIRRGIYRFRHHTLNNPSLVDYSPVSGKFIYYNGKWATSVLEDINITKPTKQSKSGILSKSSIPDKNSSKEELLEYAKKNYPVGTKFRTDTGSIFTIQGENITWYITRPHGIGDAIYEINTEGLIYCRGKWAEIISLPEQPTSTQEVKPKQKGIYLDVNKLESLSIQSLRELAVTKLVDVDKKKLIDLITE